MLPPVKSSPVRFYFLVIIISMPGGQRHCLFWYLKSSVDFPCRPFSLRLFLVCPPVVSVTLFGRPCGEVDQVRPPGQGRNTALFSLLLSPSSSVFSFYRPTCCLPFLPFFSFGLPFGRRCFAFVGRANLSLLICVPSARV